LWNKKKSASLISFLLFSFFVRRSCSVFGSFSFSGAFFAFIKNFYLGKQVYYITWMLEDLSNTLTKIPLQDYLLFMADNFVIRL